MNYLYLDVATAPIHNATEFVDGEDISAPSNWKDEVKIAAYVAEKKQERIARCGLDMDLARISGIAWAYGPEPAKVFTHEGGAGEMATLMTLATELEMLRPCIITYNGHAFDLPLLQRRARYLGINFPRINTDRFRSPHLDLLLELTDRDTSRRRSLEFYRRRLGWTDLVKPLTGEEEARIFESNRWDDLRESLRVDVETLRRLAAWLGIGTPSESAVA